MVTVACVLVRRSDGSILAVSRPEPPLRFGLPGGVVERGESPDQAARRELFEETGLHVSGHLVKIYDAIVESGAHVMAFEAPRVFGDLRSSHEGLAAWVPAVTLIAGDQAAYPEYTRRVFKIARVRL